MTRKPRGDRSLEHGISVEGFDFSFSLRVGKEVVMVGAVRLRTVGSGFKVGVAFGLKERNRFVFGFANVHPCSSVGSLPFQVIVG